MYLFILGFGEVKLDCRIDPDRWISLRQLFICYVTHKPLKVDHQIFIDQHGVLSLPQILY